MIRGESRKDAYPSTTSEALKTKLLRNLGRAHGILYGKVTSVNSFFHLIASFINQVSIPADLACLQRQVEGHHGVHLHSACVATLPEPQRHGRDRCYRQQR